MSAVVSAASVVIVASRDSAVTLPYVSPHLIWSIGIATADAPFAISQASCQQCLTDEDVTDVEAGFVADPFMLRHKGVWYMFFEVLNLANNQGDIGLATSIDGKDWKYQQIVLDEEFHLSYPQVFELDNEVYMIPESCAANAIRLYRATEFPVRWVWQKNLIEKPLVDASLFYKDGMWWMFAGKRRGNDTLYLFYTDDLIAGAWTEHPKSPIVQGDPHTARPGGRVLEYDGRLYRFGQDDAPSYGRQLWAFQIDRLTTQEYSEHRLSEKPLLTASGSGWNATGMHHIDLHRTADGKSWLACLDGVRRVLKVGPFEYALPYPEDRSSAKSIPVRDDQNSGIPDQRRHQSDTVDAS